MSWEVILIDDGCSMTQPTLGSTISSWAVKESYLSMGQEVGQ